MIIASTLFRSVCNKLYARIQYGGKKGLPYKIWEFSTRIYRKRIKKKYKQKESFRYMKWNAEYRIRVSQLAFNIIIVVFFFYFQTTKDVLDI